MATAITVDIPHLEEVYGVDLHEFEHGKYPLASLIKALGLANGTPKRKQWENTRGGDTK